MKKIKNTLSAVLVGVLTVLYACNKGTDSLMPTSSATITALTCSSATFSATPTAGTTFTGTATVPYAGGNGLAYAAGSAVASSGITGLTATLTASTLTGDSGNLIFAITGTPSGAGTATFAVTFGGQFCSLSLPVAASATGTTTGTAWSMNSNLSAIVQAAEAFKATLSATQVASLQDATYNKVHAQKWSNFPIQGYRDRVGLQTNSLSTTQFAAFYNLLKVATGTATDEGNEEYLGIMAADDYLHDYSGETFGSGYYFIAYIGVPSTTGLWCLQIGGHHGTIILTFNGGKMTGGTPSFRGTEPYPTWTYNGKLYKPMVNETTAFANLMQSMSATQLASARRSAAQNDLIVGPQKDGTFPTARTGIKGSTLTSAQKDLLLAAINLYVDDLDDTAAAAVLAKYKAELDDTYLSYYGGTTMAALGDYCLIDGPGVWIEWSIQSSPTLKTGVHVHSLWRDRVADYGGN